MPTPELLASVPTTAEVAGQVTGKWLGPRMFAKQFKVFNSRARALLVSGPRLGGKCIDAVSIVWCDGRLQRIGALGSGLACGDSRPLSCQVEILDGVRWAPAATSHIYRDPLTSGKCLTSHSGYSLKCSPWHPVWSYCHGEFAFRLADDLQRLVDAGQQVWLPLKRGYLDWKDGPTIDLAFRSVNKSLLYWSAIHDRIAAVIAEHGQISWSAIGRLARTNYTTIRTFFKQRILLPHYTVPLNSDVGYLLGILVGDGSMTPKMMRRHYIGLATLDSEIVERITEILTNHFPRSSFRHRSGCNWEINSDKLASLIVHLGLDKYAHEKTIPDILLSAPRTVVRSFIQGLFDADGCALKSGFVEFCSSSQSLAADVQQILLAFGIRSALKFRRNQHRGAWHLYIWADAGLFYDLVGFGLSRKQSGRGRLARKIKQFPMAYPPDIRPLLKRLYLSRHARGARRGNLPRSNKHGGFDNLYSTNGSSVSTERLGSFLAFAKSETDPTLQQFYLQGAAFWDSLKKVSDCPVDLYDFTVPLHRNFVANGLVNHNTRAVLHKVVRHLWDTDGARVGMFARTLKSSKDGGSWTLLHRARTGILAEWFRAGIGMYYTSEVNGVPGVKVDGTTRTPGFKVRNRYGGESEMLLFSLDNDDDVEAKLKELEFSLIYFSELDKFGDRRVVTVALPSLRMGHLKFEEQMWIADCNPSEEGEQSWIYQMFYLERGMTYEEFCAHQRRQELPVLPEEDFTAFYGKLEVIEILPKDNIFVDPRQLQEVRVACGADQGLYARHVDGKWIWGGGDASRHFRAHFNRARHVIGDASGSDSEWIVALPTPHCFELITGWDLGDTRHAAAILERTLVKNRSCFCLLDELVVIGEEVSNEFFTEQMMELIQAIEGHLGRRLDLSRAWSDRSSIERYSATGDTYPYKQVLAASGERLFLQGAQKPRPRVRVKLMKELLAQDRFKVSAHCVHAIEMFRDLKKGKDENEYVVADKNKHIFDAITYALLMELAEELELNAANQAGHRPLIVQIH